MSGLPPEAGAFAPQEAQIQAEELGKTDRQTEALERREAA